MLAALIDQARLDALLTRAADEFGTPTYVYVTEEITDRLEELQSAFGRWFALSYAVKSNPNTALLRWMRGKMDNLDISSGGEFQLAMTAGWDPALLSFTGPAKTRPELETVIHGGLGELVIESLREAKLANDVACQAGLIQRVVIRIAPDRVPKGFGDHMAGRPSPFGIDIEDASESLRIIAALPNLTIAGFHIYSGTQSLKPDAICDNWRIFMSIFRTLCAEHDIRPQRLIFGSGLGVPYHPGDVPLNLADIAATIGPEFDDFKAEPRFQDTDLVLELGRHLVGEAGYFVTRTVSVKQSRGSRIVICDGGLNANLAASGNFGMVLRRNYIIHRIGGDESGSLPEEKIDISGPLCTSIDKLGGGVALPKVSEGDLIAVHGCGAYGPTASPIFFIAQTLPKEVLAIGDQLKDVTPNRG